MIRLISKVGKNKWKVQHSDGAVTLHKTKKAAKKQLAAIEINKAKRG